MNLQQRLESLKSERVVLLSHARPDADAVASIIGLTLVLRAIGAVVTTVLADAIPAALEAATVGDCTVTALHSPEGVLALKGSQLILVDCADLERVQVGWVPPDQGVFINVDHHRSNTLFAEHNYVDPTAAATAQMIAEAFLGTPWMTPRLAQVLYVGVLGDTLGFQSASTHARVFAVCARLCEAGAQPAQAAQALYYQERPEKMRLLQGFLATLQRQGPFCYGFVKKALKEEVGSLPEDTEGLVQYPLRLQGVELAALIEETSGGDLKVSLRARHEALRVDQLAARFGGGGHACAAAFRASASVLTAFLQEAYDYVDVSLRREGTGSLHP